MGGQDLGERVPRSDEAASPRRLGCTLESRAQVPKESDDKYLSHAVPAGRWWGLLLAPLGCHGCGGLNYVPTQGDILGTWRPLEGAQTNGERAPSLFLEQLRCISEGTVLYKWPSGINTS